MSSLLLAVPAEDCGLAYYEAVGMTEEILRWNILCAVSYITMAVMPFWHNRFFTYHEKKVIQIWQEENR